MKLFTNKRTPRSSAEQMLASFHELEFEPEPTKGRLLAILEATTDYVFLTDSTYQQLLFLNQSARQLWAIDRSQDLSRLRLSDYLPGKTRELIQRQGLPIAAREGVWECETSLRSGPDDEIVVSHLILAHKSSAGRLEYFSTIARDITASKKAQAALRHSEELFRLLAENATELIALVDMQGRRLYNSPSYERILGYRPDELQSTSSLEQIHAEDREKVLAAAREAKTTGIGRFIEYRMRHKDGSWRTLESHAGVVRNARGEIENLLIVARDITERKRAEKERERMEVQLRHAQKMQSIGQLAAGIAHEINTPTQYIGDNLHFLSNAFSDLKTVLQHVSRLMAAAKTSAPNGGSLSELAAAAEQADVDYLTIEIPRAIEQSLEGVERVSKIVQAMKEFSHPGTETKAVIDLNKAIESTITVARNEWKYVAEVVTSFDPSLPMVPCHPGEFNQVILNLIVNGAHAIAAKLGDGSQSKGTIKVSTQSDGDWVEIRIADSGTGIPETIRERVFEPFFTTKPMGIGTGQGLAIAHAVIVDKHGGTIDFESEPGQGTTFIIRLPTAPSSGARARPQ